MSCEPHRLQKKTYEKVLVQENPFKSYGFQILEPIEDLHLNLEFKAGHEKAYP